MAQSVIRAAPVILAIMIVAGGCFQAPTPNASVKAALMTPDGSRTLGWATIQQRGAGRLSVYVEFSDRATEGSLQVSSSCVEDAPVPSLPLAQPTDGASETFLFGELADFAGLSVQVRDPSSTLVIACGTF